MEDVAAAPRYQSALALTTGQSGNNAPEDPANFRQMPNNASQKDAIVTTIWPHFVAQDAVKTWGQLNRASPGGNDMTKRSAFGFIVLALAVAGCANIEQTTRNGAVPAQFEVALIGTYR